MCTRSSDVLKTTVPLTIPPGTYKALSSIYVPIFIKYGMRSRNCFPLQMEKYKSGKQNNWAFLNHAFDIIVPRKVVQSRDKIKSCPHFFWQTSD